MKKTTIVAIMSLSTQCFAGNLNSSLQDIETEWASIHYNTPQLKQEPAYNKLYMKVVNLAKDYPYHAEPLIWEAIIKACNAENINAIDALDNIQEAHDLLQNAIKINPSALGGSAYVTLGALYQLTPEWPIGFGDIKIAKSLYESAIKISPTGLESNHFYAEYLLSQDELDVAEKYYRIALSAPSRPEQKFADDKIKELTKVGLEKIKQRKHEKTNSLFSSFLKKDNIN